jgi:hypothetical protein
MDRFIAVCALSVLIGAGSVEQTQAKGPETPAQPAAAAAPPLLELEWGGAIEEGPQLATPEGQSEPQATEDSPAPPPLPRPPLRSNLVSIEVQESKAASERKAAEQPRTFRSSVVTLKKSKETPPPPVWPTESVGGLTPDNSAAHVECAVARPVPITPLTPEPTVPATTSVPAALAGTPASASAAHTPAVPDPSVTTDSPTAAGKDLSADCHVLLCKARELYYCGDLELAKQSALKLRQYRSVRWGNGEDSPDKLLVDIEKAQFRRDQEASAVLLTEARKQFQQGNLDEAERKARESAALRRSWNGWFAPRGDTPEKLLAEIGTVRMRRARARTLEAAVAAAKHPAPTAPSAETAQPKQTPSANVPPPIPAAESIAVLRAPETGMEIQPVAGYEKMPQGQAPAEAVVPAVTRLPDLPIAATPAPTPEDKAVTTVQTVSAPAEAAPAPKQTGPALATPRPLPQPLPGPEPTDDCQCLCPCCMASCAGLRLNADVGFAVLWPYWRNNPAFVVTGGRGVPTTSQVDFNYDAQFVPQVSLGLQSPCGLGFRAGWWGFVISDAESFRGAASGVSAAPLGLQAMAPFAAANLSAFSDLHLNVWDFEATDECRCGPWELLVSGGVRYTHMSQSYVAVATSAGLPQMGVLSGHNFDGAGPTLALAADRLLGDTHFYFFGNCRGSILFGTARQSASLTAGPAFADTQDALSSTQTMLPVGELELGLGWSRDMGAAHVYVRGGMISQLWFEAGNASRSSVQFLGGALANNSTIDPNLGLFGFSLRVGVDY